MVRKRSGPTPQRQPMDLCFSVPTSTSTYPELHVTRNHSFAIQSKRSPLRGELFLEHSKQPPPTAGRVLVPLGQCNQTPAWIQDSH